MAQNNYISIPKPCSQNWQEMTIAEKGRFCGSCQKNVFDFTNLSDREITTALKSNKNVCGRFNVSQLNRELIVQREKSSAWMIIVTSVISFLGLSNNEVHSQENIIIEQTNTKTLADEKTTIIKEKDSIEISGTIYDNSNIPLPGVSIHIKETSIGTLTDFEGNYKIIAKEDDILVYSYIGFRTEKIIVNLSSKETSLTLKPDLESLTLGVVIYAEKRTFFGRIFNSIGNIFR